MQSTGHSSMHALSSRSTHGSAITYVTGAVLSRMSVPGRVARSSVDAGGVQGASGKAEESADTGVVSVDPRQRRRSSPGRRPRRQMAGRHPLSMPLMAAADPVGHKVVVRRVSEGRHTDVVGVLVDAGPEVLVVRRRDGSHVEIGRATVTAMKAVPAAPRDVLALEEVAALGWPAPETRRLGRWLLRAAEGWTGRGNSVLPLGDPGLPLDDALAEVTAWYGE